jgi:hypothetical protein
VDEAHGHAIGLVKETRGLPALVVTSMGEENGAPQGAPFSFPVSADRLG